MTSREGWAGSSSDLHEVLQSAGDGITVQGPDGALVYANDAAARQVGFATAEEFLAAPIADVMARYEAIGEDAVPLPLDALPGRRVLAGEPETEVVVGFRTDQRPEVRWSLVQATPVLRDDGAVRFVINVFRDITELKRTEARLRALATAGVDPACCLRVVGVLVPLFGRGTHDATLSSWSRTDVSSVFGVRRTRA